MENQEKSVERYLSTGELMDMLSISRSTVYRLMEKGLPNMMVGSVHRFPVEQVLTWLKGLHSAQRGNRNLIRKPNMVGLDVEGN